MQNYNAHKPGQVHPLTPEEVRILRQSPMWLHLEEYLNYRIQQESHLALQPVNPDQCKDHNLRVGKIQAFREILNYPDASSPSKRV